MPHPSREPTRIGNPPAGDGPSMMAAWYERTGAAGDVLRVGQMPIPSPHAGEVRVRVHASGVNPSDTKRRGGWGGGGMRHPRVVPHNDGAGVIDILGAGVDPGRLGERVWINEAQQDRPFGTAAEWTVVPDFRAVTLPDDVDFAAGAALGVPAMTAHRALFMDGPVAGLTILVAGGAGAVGHAAVQLAKWGGATVIATASGNEQAAVARAAGADHVLDRRIDDIASSVLSLTNGGVDRVVEVAFEANLDIDLAILKPNGTIATYASGDADSAPILPFYRALTRGLTIHFIYVYLMSTDAHADAARDITGALASGRLRPRIGRSFSLDQIAEAHEAQDGSGSSGKILVIPPTRNEEALR